MELEGRERYQVIAKEWLYKLASCPSLFGQMVYLHKRRDRDTGVYTLRGWEKYLSHAQVQRLFRETHHRVFGEWMELDGSAKLEDVELYIGQLTGHRSVIIRTWSLSEPYMWPLPLGLAQFERDLYRDEFEMVFRQLKRRKWQE